MCAINGVSDISKGRDASSAMRFSWPGWWKTEGFLKKCLVWIACMGRSSATTGLIVDASRVLQERVGMLYDPNQGVAIVVSGHVSRKVASCWTRTESLRSEFVRVPLGFLSEISALMMSGGQGCRNTRLVPDPDGFSHTPPVPMPEASQNPR